jgi:hypothetical protein
LALADADPLTGAPLDRARQRRLVGEQQPFRPTVQPQHRREGLSDERYFGVRRIACGYDAPDNSSAPAPLERPGAWPKQESTLMDNQDRRDVSHRDVLRTAYAVLILAALLAVLSLAVLVATVTA